MAEGHVWQGCVHGRGIMHGMGHVWWGACVVGGMCGGGHVWQGSMCGRACVAGGMHGRRGMHAPPPNPQPPGEQNDRQV